MKQRMRSFNVLAAMLLASFGAAKLFAQDESLAAWYKMEEVVQSGSVRKVADASGNSRDLTLGAGCWLTNGIAVLMQTLLLLVILLK